MDSEISYCYPGSNASCTKLQRLKNISALLYLSSGTLTVITVFGNLFVIITISHFRQLHTPTNFFILSLAVADFLSGFLITPVQFSVLVDYCWYFGDAFCPYYHTYFISLLFVSVLNLVSISADRCFALCNPFSYSRKITNSVAGICIIFIWLLAFLYTYAFIFHTGGSVVTDWCVGMCTFYQYNDLWIAHHVVTFLLPIVIIICLYTVVFITARRHIKAIRCMIEEGKSAGSKKREISKSSERKAAKTLGIVIIAFILFCSPSFAYTLVQICFTIDSPDLASVQVIVNFLTTMNCCVDPIIYALFYPWFRKSLKMIMTLEIFKSSSSLVNLFQN